MNKKKALLSSLAALALASVQAQTFADEVVLPATEPVPAVTPSTDSTNANELDATQVAPTESIIATENAQEAPTVAIVTPEEALTNQLAEAQDTLVVQEQELHQADAQVETAQADVFAAQTEQTLAQTESIQAQEAVADTTNEAPYVQAVTDAQAEVATAEQSIAVTAAEKSTLDQEVVALQATETQALAAVSQAQNAVAESSKVGSNASFKEETVLAIDASFKTENPESLIQDEALDSVSKAAPVVYSGARTENLPFDASYVPNVDNVNKEFIKLLDELRELNGIQKTNFAENTPAVKAYTERRTNETDPMRPSHNTTIQHNDFGLSRVAENVGGISFRNTAYDIAEIQLPNDTRIASDRHMAYHILLEFFAEYNNGLRGQAGTAATYGHAIPFFRDFSAFEAPIYLSVGLEKSDNPRSLKGTVNWLTTADRIVEKEDRSIDTQAGIYTQKDRNNTIEVKHDFATKVQTLYINGKRAVFLPKITFNYTRQVPVEAGPNTALIKAQTDLAKAQEALGVTRRTLAEKTAQAESLNTALANLNQQKATAERKVANATTALENIRKENAVKLQEASAAQKERIALANQKLEAATARLATANTKLSDAMAARAAKAAEVKSTQDVIVELTKKLAPADKVEAAVEAVKETFTVDLTAKAEPKVNEATPAVATKVEETAKEQNFTFVNATAPMATVKSNKLPKDVTETVVVDQAPKVVVRGTSAGKPSSSQSRSGKVFLPETGDVASALGLVGVGLLALSAVAFKRRHQAG